MFNYKIFKASLITIGIYLLSSFFFFFFNKTWKIKEINAIAFSPDNKFLASAEKDNTIKLWRMPVYIGWLRSLVIYGSLGALVYWRRKDLISWINS